MHGPNVAQGLALAIVLVGGIVLLPTLIGVAVSVARLEREGRWNALGIGVIVSLVITGVSTELIGLESGLIAGAAGVLGGGVLGAIIGGLVRAKRRRRRG